MIFPYKCFYLILYQRAKFQCHTSFPSQDIKQNVLLSLLFRQLMSQSIRFILDQPLKQWLTGRKSGEDGNTKIWISWERKELSDEIKYIFHIFWRAIIWLKIKKWWKIVDTSFNFMQKIEKFHASIFHKTWKTIFWAYFRSFWNKNSNSPFGPKIPE